MIEKYFFTRKIILFIPKKLTKEIINFESITPNVSLEIAEIKTYYSGVPNGMSSN